MVTKQLWAWTHPNSVSSEMQLNNSEDSHENHSDFSMTSLRIPEHPKTPLLPEEIPVRVELISKDAQQMSGAVSGGTLWRSSSELSNNYFTEDDMSQDSMIMENFNDAALSTYDSLCSPNDYGAEGFLQQQADASIGHCYGSSLAAMNSREESDMMAHQLMFHNRDVSEVMGSQQRLAEPHATPLASILSNYDQLHHQFARFDPIDCPTPTADTNNNFLGSGFDSETCTDGSVDYSLTRQVVRGGEACAMDCLANRANNQPDDYSLYHRKSLIGSTRNGTTTQLRSNEGNKFGSLVQQCLPPPPVSIPRKQHDTRAMYFPRLAQEQILPYLCSVPLQQDNHCLHTGSTPNFQPISLYQQSVHPTTLFLDPRNAFQHPVFRQRQELMENPETGYFPIYHQKYGRHSVDVPNLQTKSCSVRQESPIQSCSAISPFRIESPEELQPMKKVDVKRWMQINNI